MIFANINYFKILVFSILIAILLSIGLFWFTKNYGVRHKKNDEKLFLIYENAQYLFNGDTCLIVDANSRLRELICLDGRSIKLDYLKYTKKLTDYDK